MSAMIKPLIRNIASTSLAVLAFATLHVNAQQIENVIVETYYVSDASDATDTICGPWGLAEGSRTYRIFLDLGADCSLRALYGSTDHALIFQSTAPFFNHLDRGRTYGHQINNSALYEGTTALDSWLSMGAASNQRYGIEKEADTDGSIIGGANNDGGSSAVPAGLLVNNTTEMVHALTERDGLTPLNGGAVLPPSFNVVGDDPGDAFSDSTLVNAFMSSDHRMLCSTPGVTGPTSENRILIAQITTAGELSFELNVELECGGELLRFTARDTLLATDETANGLLVYPPQCGCTDPNFLEYDPAAGCDDGSCATAIVFGCLDPDACNYDPSANFNVDQLCCYGPDDCNGLDVKIVCPDVGIEPVITDEFQVNVGPVPTGGLLNLRFTTGRAVRLRGALCDALGHVVLENDHGIINGTGAAQLDLEALPPGVYFLLLEAEGTRIERVVIKN